MIAKIIFTIAIFTIAFIFYLISGVMFYTSKKDILGIIAGLLLLCIALCINSFGLLIWDI